MLRLLERDVAGHGSYQYAPRTVDGIHTLVQRITEAARVNLRGGLPLTYSNAFVGIEFENCDGRVSVDILNWPHHHRHFAGTTLAVVAHAALERVSGYDGILTTNVIDRGSNAPSKAFYQWLWRMGVIQNPRDQIECATFMANSMIANWQMLRRLSRVEWMNMVDDIASHVPVLVARHSPTP